MSNRQSKIVIVIIIVLIAILALAIVVLILSALIISNNRYKNIMFNYFMGDILIPPSISDIIDNPYDWIFNNCSNIKNNPTIRSLVVQRKLLFIDVWNYSSISQKHDLLCVISDIDEYISMSLWPNHEIMRYYYQHYMRTLDIKLDRLLIVSTNNMYGKIFSCKEELEKVVKDIYQLISNS